MYAKRTVLGWALCLSIFCAPLAQAIEPDEVRNFEDVFLISAFAPDRNSIEIKWDIAAGYYLYNNKFLQFRVETPGRRPWVKQSFRGVKPVLMSC